MLPNKRKQRRRTSATKPDKPTRRRGWVGIAALVTALSSVILALQQVDLAKKQDIMSFQLQQTTELGGMSLLLEKVYQIDAEFLNLNRGNYAGRNLSEDSAREFSRKLEKLKDIFVSEMDNPYLNSRDTIKQLWSLAYFNIGGLNQQVEFNLMNVGEKIQNLNTGKVETGKFDSEQLRKIIIPLYGELFKSVGAATSYIYGKIKEDRIKWGLLGKDGNPKVNPEDFYIRVDKTK